MGKMMALAAGLLAATQAVAQDRHDLPGRVIHLSPPSVHSDTVSYGPDPSQKIEFSVKPGAGTPPLIIFIGPQAWESSGDSYPTFWLRSAFFEAGYAFASLDYRAKQSTSATTMIVDLRTGFTKLLTKATQLGFDPDRIALVGQGSGGHLAVLAATDPALLGESGMRAIKAVVTVNGDGFDVPARIRSAGNFRQRIYERAFGNDPAVQAKLSPASHLAPPNAPSFLFLYATNLSDAAQQSRSMAAALATQGTRADHLALDIYRRDVLRSYLGGTGNEGFKQLTGFLRTSLDQQP